MCPKIITMRDLLVLSRLTNMWFTGSFLWSSWRHGYVNSIRPISFANNTIASWHHGYVNSIRPISFANNTIASWHHGYVNSIRPISFANNTIASWRHGYVNSIRPISFANNTIAAINFLKSKGLLASSMNCTCGVPMNWVTRTTSACKDGRSWRCPKL